jgi:hypothetical protein
MQFCEIISARVWSTQMLEILVKFKPFAFEMAIGALVAALGLLQLVYGVPPLFSDPEMLRKFAASLITIGGTIFASGAFRFVFSMRLDRSEHVILQKLDEVSRWVGETLKEAGSVFAGTVSKLQPAGVKGTPQDHFTQYRFLYWRTQDTQGAPTWLRFAELTWKKQVLPFLEAETEIAHPDFDKHHYVLALVELSGCVAVVATRFKASGAPHNEMAGVYVLTIPINLGKQLSGYLRHVSMNERQCLSSCILSTEKLDGVDLDQLWRNAEGGGKVERNFAPTAMPAPAQA